VVVKPDRGGGGYLVRLVETRENLEQALEALRRVEQRGDYGFVVQRYHDTGCRDLRVVVIGDCYLSYWRCQSDPGEFRTNLGRGAHVDADSWPEQQQAACELVRAFCEASCLNLAAFDLIFPGDRGDSVPLFLEVNFCFGRRGIGGTPRFRNLLRRAVHRWQDTLGA
jgi:ribosomal protein S6--L-glutamate ligase